MYSNEQFTTSREEQLANPGHPALYAQLPLNYASIYSQLRNAPYSNTRQQQLITASSAGVSGPSDSPVRLDLNGFAYGPNSGFPSHPYAPGIHSTAASSSSYAANATAFVTPSRQGPLPAHGEGSYDWGLRASSRQNNDNEVVGGRPWGSAWDPRNDLFEQGSPLSFVRNNTSQYMSPNRTSNPIAFGLDSNVFASGEINHLNKSRCKRKRVHEPQVDPYVPVKERKVKGTVAMCCICFEKEVKYVLVPCGHPCLCEDCASMGLKECPICRSCSARPMRFYGTLIEDVEEEKGEKEVVLTKKVD